MNRRDKELFILKFFNIFSSKNIGFHNNSNGWTKVFFKYVTYIREIFYKKKS